MMMRLFFLALFTGLFFVCKATPIKWDGQAGDDLWTTASNWSGDVVPGPADDVLLDNSLKASTYTVFLPNTGVTIRSLTITPTAGMYLITLTLPFTNTLTSGAFTTNGGLGNYSVIINSGGTFDNNGNVSLGSGTNITIADSIRINNGGYYQHRTKSDISGWINKLSSAPGTEDGTFIFAVPASSYSASMGGLNFGTIIFGTATMGSSITYSVSGSSPLNIRGGFTVNTDVTVNNGMSGDIVVKKTLLLLSGSTLDLQTAANNNVLNCEENFLSFGTLTKSGSGIPKIRLNGTSLQNVSIIGSFTNNVEFNVDNPAGITLGTPVTLPYKLILTNGKIRTTSGTLLTLVDNATCSGGSASSFIEGPMKKIGDDGFLFPVGIGSIYAPISISGSGGSTTDEFTAEYKRANPQSTFGMSYASPIDHISYVEYWNLQRNPGNVSLKSITLAIHRYSFARNISTLLVSRFNSSQWVNLNKITFSVGPMFPPNETGTITSFETTLGGPFTLATADPFTVNPLPIDLITFDVTKIDNKKAVANWKLAECCSSGAKFELERAGEDKRFVFVASVTGSETSTLYNTPDNDLKTGVNYYRLKMINDDGKVTYSRIVTVLNGSKKVAITMSPTIVADNVLLTITSIEPERLELVIADMNGRIVKKINQQIFPGDNNISLSLGDLHSGMYQLIGVTAEGEKNVVRFLKQ